MNMKKYDDDELKTLIDGKTSSNRYNNHYQRQSSRLEWAESSWTRCLHLWFWWWVNPILSLGYKRPLTDNDFDDLPHDDKSSILLDRLHSYDWTRSTTWKIVVQEFWKEFMVIGLTYIPFIISRIVQPLILRQIILIISNRQRSPTVAYFYAILLFICAVIQMSLPQLIGFRANRVGVRIRNALTSTIYKHSLCMKLASFQQITTAHIINLIAKDTAKFEEACRFLHDIWGGTVEVMIVFGILCWIIGLFPTLFVYITLVLFIFIQLLFSRKFHKYREITASYSDKRIHAYNEFIHGCHIIKMYGWEKLMEDRIYKMRQNELASIRSAFRLRALNQVQFFISTPFFALVAFGSMWLLKYPLVPTDIFTALAFFSIMRQSIIYTIPISVERLSEVRFASKNIDSFMRSAILQEQQSLSSTDSLNYHQQKGRIIMSDASFSWNNDHPCLSSLNIIIEPGTFVGIIGPVGSGKSSLFNAILGEMNIVNGQLNTNDSSFGYANQSSWIFADTLRNNILLGRSFDEQRYRNVIYACCLDVDLSLFRSSGDLIMIGERGVNLSGGQKARVSLARTLYGDADIYLLDDPLAAVDRTVAKQIYERCIGPYGLLKHKTRLLITHQMQFLVEAHQKIFLVHGHIDKEGHFDESNMKNDDTELKEDSTLFSMLDFNQSIADTESIIVEEKSVSGTVSWSLWCRLFTASPLGWFGLCLLIITLLTAEFFYDVTNYWLMLWSRRSYKDQQSHPIYVYICIGLTLAILFVDLLRSNYFYFLILHGSNRLHNNMLKGLLYTSIQFFENNPSGRIINRASKDQQIIDESVPVLLFTSIEMLLMVAGSVIVICLINPYVLLTFVVLIPLFWVLTRFYLQSNRDLKRLESVSRSPVYTLFSSTLNGLSTIRAFKAKDHFIQLLTDRIDANTRAYIIMQGASYWFNLRLHFIACFFTLVTAVLVVVFRNQIGPSSAALSLTYIIAGMGWFSWGFRLLVEVEILMTSAERIDEYTRLPSEEDYDGQKRLIQTSADWPNRGTIEFRNYSMSYRLHVEPILKNLTLRIESGEKIGIIGRTGIY
jgi:ABC-type multidrug transport system fused ATPase/permease subunit